MLVLLWCLFNVCPEIPDRMFEMFESSIDQKHLYFEVCESDFPLQPLVILQWNYEYPNYQLVDYCAHIPSGLKCWRTQQLRKPNASDVHYHYKCEKEEKIKW